MRQASESTLQQQQEALLVAALQRSLGAKGFRVLAPVGPKPDSYKDTTYARALVGNWSDGPAPDFVVSVSVRMLVDDREENDFYINHPGLSSLVYVISSTSKPVKFAITLSFAQPAARSPMGDFRALVKTGAYRAFQSGEWVMEQDEEDLADWVSDVTTEFTDATECLPRVFTVRRDGPARFSVDAGRMRGVTEGAWLLVGDRELMVNNVVSDLTLDTLLMLKVVRADDHRAQAEPLPAGEGARVSGRIVGHFALKRKANMKLIVRTWLTACVALVTVTAAQMTLAQSVISDNDVARLRAFIGENDFDAKTPSGAGVSASSLSGGSVVNGVYKVRPGDTLAKSWPCIWATQALTTTSCKK